MKAEKNDESTFSTGYDEEVEISTPRRDGEDSSVRDTMELDNGAPITNPPVLVDSVEEGGLWERELIGVKLQLENNSSLEIIGKQ